MKYIALAAMISAFALAPTAADAQSNRDGSRHHSQQHQHQRHDANRSQHQRGNRGQHRDNRGQSRRAVAQRDHRGHSRRDVAHRNAHARAQHRGHIRPAPVYRSAPPARYYRPAPQRRVTTMIHVRQPVHHYTRYQRGQYLPAYYRSGHYYVDHRHYGFAPPPRGYRYARVDNDAVLIGVATGLIAAILVGAFH